MPYTPDSENLPDYVKKLSESDRERWTAIWNKTYTECKDSGGEDCEAEAFQRANGVVLKDNEKGQVQTNVVDRTYRTSWDGKDWLVVPTVMIREGVLNGELVPGEELAKYPAAWNGRPFVIEHPKGADGLPISAGAPDVMVKSQAGFIFGAEYDEANKSIPAELWIDVDKAKKIPTGAQLLQRILKSDRVEVSTGYFRDKENQSGEWGGMPYEGIARNLRPDHLAALMNSVGACSWEDGCGCPRVNEDGEPCDDGLLWTKPADLTYNADKYSHIDFKPPEGVRKAYRNGLERHENGETGDGLEQSTVRQARKFAGGGAASPEWARKGNRWWGRNERFKDEEPGTPAYAAAQLWGGRNWFARIVEQMDAADKQDNEDEDMTKENERQDCECEDDPVQAEQDEPKRNIVKDAFRGLAEALGFTFQGEIETMAKSKDQMVGELCDRLELNADEDGEGLSALSAKALRAILNAMKPPEKEKPEEEPEEDEPIPQEDDDSEQDEQTPVEDEADEPEDDAAVEPQANEQPCADARFDALEAQIKALEQRNGELETRLEQVAPVVQQHQEAQRREKERLVSDLVENERCAFDKDELEKMDVPQLRKLDRSLAPRNYAGQAGTPIQANKKRRLVPYKTVKEK